MRLGSVCEVIIGQFSSYFESQQWIPCTEALFHTQEKKHGKYIIAAQALHEMLWKDSLIAMQCNSHTSLFTHCNTLKTLL